jgi:hypothetical protein
MKNGLLLFICLLTSFDLLAQERKKVNDDVPGFGSRKAEYEVLKTDHKIKDGYYKEVLAYNGNVVKTGYFKDGKRDSLWIYYTNQGKVINKGNYKNDKRDGLWEYYDQKGALFSKYDFNIRDFTYINRSKEDSIKVKKAKYEVIKGVDTLSTLLDRPLCYLGGNERISRFMADNIRMPVKVKESGISGRVVISFTVDTDGHPINFRVKKALGYGCEEEVIRVIKLLDGDWLPAIFEGQAVAAITEIPVSFTIFK